MNTWINSGVNILLNAAVTEHELTGLALVFDDFGERALEVFIALAPLVIIFVAMNLFSLKLPRSATRRIYLSFIITYIGLVLFMQGVFVAFKPIGEKIGGEIADLSYNWILIPIGFVMGFVVAFAEPAVRVLNNQVEEMSGGSIKKITILLSISIGVAIAVMLSMIKILFTISLWYFILPGYIIVFALSKYVNPTFVAIAFDSGGVATGPMCSTFVLSFAIGVANSSNLPNANPMRDGLGMVSLVAMAPIISIMVLSFLYKGKGNNSEKLEEEGLEREGVN